MKLAIITGASKGLGRALVDSFLEKGYEVLGCARTETKLPEGATFFCVDFSNPLEAIEKIKKEYENIDKNWSEIILINNAALLGPINLLHECDASKLARSIEVNIAAPMLLNSWLMKETSKLKARVALIGISSGAAFNAYAGWSTYCSSKAANLMMSRCIAIEEEDRDFCVEAWDYNPGVIDTEMQDLIRSAQKKDFPRVQKFLDLKKEGLLKDPKVVADHLVSVAIKTQESGSIQSFS